MACAKRLNKPVFIDFTGHGCVNCREMEARVWSDQRVLDILAKEYVIIALYVDEKTIMLPEEEHYFSKVTGRKVTSLDKKNADIQICMFGTNSQPNYILLDNNEQLLNYPAQYDLNVNTFIDFLKTGVKNYKEQKQTQTKEAI
jgi:thiol:disulfide interchange protein DsbD